MVTMSILQRFRIVQRIYFLIGIAPWDADQKHESCVYIIPLSISFLSNIGVALLQFFAFYLHSYGLLIKIINYAYFGVLVISNVTANLQCWYYKDIYQDIIERIKRLENECNFKFSRNILQKPVKNNYTVKALCIIGFFSVSAGIVLGQAWAIGSNSIKAIALASLTVLKEFMSALAVLHFTLYMDIVRLFISELNNQILCSPISFFESSKIAFLKDVKFFHMEVYLLIKQINHFFGWHLLFVMVHYLVLITYNFYWIFLMIQSNGKSFSITGEF